MFGVDLFAYAPFGMTSQEVLTSIVWYQQCPKETTWTVQEKEERVNIGCDSTFAQIYTVGD
jgi:hypothetical protein